ncbi:MAG: hypothetical protein ONA90_03905, partial [candidate division KSB1 bacterium]|nr:hypothetical protein [candidate division KSB1 bacterium]
MSSSREQILNRLRKSPVVTSEVESTSLPVFDDAKIYRDHELARHQPMNFFAEKLAALKGEFYLSRDTPAAAKILRTLLSEMIAEQNAQIQTSAVQALAA